MSALPDTGPCRACGKEATGYFELCDDKPPFAPHRRMFACEEHETVVGEALAEFQRARLS